MNVRLIAKTIFFFLLLFILCPPLYGDIPEVERNALLALYNGTNGAAWGNSTNWNGDPGTENTWFGVTCDADNTMVLQIDLNGNNLSGTIPTELGNLSQLTYLNISNNQLSGAIPAELGNLGNLKELNLHSNQLSEVPVQLGNLTGLTHLYLGGNQLSGNILTTLSNLTNLKDLFLDTNRISGDIPAQLGNLTALQRIRLQGNRLGGNIPAAFANLVNLEDNNSDFRWNALYTGDQSLAAFLDKKQVDGDWGTTQTIAPAGVNAIALDPATIRVNWTLIPYTADSGGYTVLYSETSGGPYTSFATTGDKSVPSMDVTGLTEGRGYYFVVETHTDSHGNNANNLRSDYSAETYAQPSNDISISGRITTANGDGIPGATLTFSHDAGIAVSDEQGVYSHVISPGWSGTVIPGKAGYQFEPPERTYENVNASITGENYTTVLNTVTISGRITTRTGIGISGVALGFSDNGTAITDADGTYSQAVIHGWSGEVIPLKIGFEFDPLKKVYSNVIADERGQDYYATPTSPVISGTIMDSGGNGIDGVTLFFSNDGGWTDTNSKGKFLHAVNNGWSGTVTPQKAGYSFQPQDRTFTDVNTDLEDVNFNGETTLPKISGYITSDGVGLAEVRLDFSENGGTTRTDDDGFYSHGVPYGWTGKVTPSKEKYFFSPRRRPYDKPVQADLPGEDYEARSDLPVISGVITFKTSEGGSAPLPGVTVKYQDKIGSVSVLTDAQGRYGHAVAEGWIGTVTPSLAGFIFSDTSHEYNGVTASRADQNFIASHTDPVISGTIRKPDGSTVENVMLTFSDANSTEVIYTGADGSYSRPVKYGTTGWTGTVTPAKPGFRFDPQFGNYMQLTLSKIQDYLCIPNVTINMAVTRETESTTAIRKHYGKIDLTVVVENNVSFSICRIYRKEDGGAYVTVTDIPFSQLENGVIYTWYDRYLDKNKGYTYKAVALSDPNDGGSVIAQSGEISI